MEEKQNRAEENQSRGTDFMKETIKQRPLNRKKLIRRTLITASMAVIFGTVACLTFLLLEPVISNRLYPEEDPSAVVFVEETEEEEILPEDMIADESQMQEEKEPAPALNEEQIALLLAEMKMGTKEYTSLYQSLYEIAREVQRSMVTVVGVTSDVDLFDNPYESEGMISGVLIADNGRELLVLADTDAMKEADSFRITFADESEYQAALKKKDYNTGFAVLAVAKDEVAESTLEAVQTVSMGTSAVSNPVGMPVIALGQPMGAPGSLCYGFITAGGIEVYLPDSLYKMMTTDIYGSTAATGILVNLNGQMIGMIDNDNRRGDIENLICGIGVTELKKTIEKLSNGEEIAYLGVYGADAAGEPDLANGETEIPEGAFIMEIDVDSPAMEAGLQSGDVITRIGETQITAYSDLVSSLISCQPEQPVVIGFLRQGPEGYTEMELTVVLGMKE